MSEDVGRAAIPSGHEALATSKGVGAGAVVATTLSADARPLSAAADQCAAASTASARMSSVSRALRAENAGLVFTV